MDTQSILQQMESEMRAKNYSPLTIRSYTNCLGEYLGEQGSLLLSLDNDNVREFLLRKRESGAAAQTINLYLNAIRFFLRHIAKRSPDTGAGFAKQTKTSPVFFSHQEIEKILSVVKNPKHRLMLALAYGSGLRVSEVVSLRVGDIDLDALTIKIGQAGGQESRITIFPESLEADARDMIVGKTGDDFLFTSERGGQLTTRAAQQTFERALCKANIDKKATFHSLRHSFAVHLLESGVSTQNVQKLLGHRNARATQIYKKLAKSNSRMIRSPL